MKAVGVLAILTLLAVTWGNINDVTTPNQHHHLRDYNQDLFLVPNIPSRIVHHKSCTDNGNNNVHHKNNNNYNDKSKDTHFNAEADAVRSEEDAASSKYISELDLDHTYDWAGTSPINDFSLNPKNDNSDYPLNEEKRNNANANNQEVLEMSSQQTTPCACQTKYELFDLGYTHFPRYLVNAVCQHRTTGSRKCWRGSKCKEIPYKVRVLTHRSESDTIQTDILSSLLPDTLRNMWKFKTITVAAACQCAL